MPDVDGYIYAIAMRGTPYVKIGSTRTSVEDRCKTLQTAQPFDLEVITAVAIHADLQTIERLIHRYLAAYWRRGEWFTLPIDAAHLAALVHRAECEIAQVQMSRRAERDAFAVFRVRMTAARLTKGWSCERLAKEANIEPHWIDRIEADGWIRLSLYQARDIARALGVGLDYLVDIFNDEDPVSPHGVLPAWRPVPTTLPLFRNG